MIARYMLSKLFHQRLKSKSYVMWNKTQRIEIPDHENNMIAKWLDSDMIRIQSDSKIIGFQNDSKIIWCQNNWILK